MTRFALGAKCGAFGRASAGADSLEANALAAMLPSPRLPVKRKCRRVVAEACDGERSIAGVTRENMRRSDSEARSRWRRTQTLRSASPPTRYDRAHAALPTWPE